MSLKVIGAGFGRTGTMSLKLALEALGLGPCYHMVEVNRRPEHDAMWLALALGETADWRPMLDGFASTVDWPTTFFWKRLAADNPDARIILTLRDPEEWYASCAATIFARMEEAMRAPSSDPVRRTHMLMVNTLIVDKTFGDSLAKDNAIGVFKAHNQEVASTAPKDRLLVYDIRQGWEPLCLFLGVPVPPTPFPAANSRDDFAARFPKPRNGAAP
jgi:hypothetical protein